MSVDARVVLSVLVLLITVTALPLAQADWQDWWKTPEQQAKAALDAGNAERLKQIAPDARWQGVAEHESSEFEAAAKTFEQTALQLQQDGETGKANKALYNQGVSEVRAGQYEQAVDTFDQVLEQDPEFADAQHNRNIAEQLIQQQEQQQQQQQQNGDEGDDSSQQDSDQQGEQEQSSESGEQSEESSEGDQGEQSEQAQDQQPESGDGQQGDENDESAEPNSEEQQTAEEQAAQEALDAEAAEAENAEQNDSQTGTPMQEREQPLSESDQATEQWLRRIPDDPAGLLRRKLEQSHRSEYPQVGNGRETW